MNGWCSKKKGHGVLHYYISAAEQNSSQRKNFCGQYFLVNYLKKDNQQNIETIRIYDQDWKNLGKI